MRRLTLTLLLAAALALPLAIGCSGGSTPDDGGDTLDKLALWTEGTQLRGANIHQRRIYPELDGDAFGTGLFGLPFQQSDLDALAALGANYVNLSHPGLYTEQAPYQADAAAVANLDALLAMIEAADMFAVITFRTGPGRSEFSFWGDDDLPPGYVLNTVWEDQAAQDGWVAMWRYTAERYADSPVVIGYDLMCEPNSNALLYDEYDPEAFYAAHRGQLEDWGQLYPRITTAIREVDETTPILVSAMSWGMVDWLPYLEPTTDAATVYTTHQYAPQQQYTHQDAEGENTYPGSYDINYDGAPDTFDQAWLAAHLSTLTTFATEHDVPVAVNEFGVRRWVPNGADFMTDEMNLFDQIGVNNALWSWCPPSFDQLDTVDEFDFRFGPDPTSHDVSLPNDLHTAIAQYWSRNTVRPSEFGG